jgi:hypothetical protein
MTKFPIHPLGPTTLDKMREVYVGKRQDWRRDHLGASLLGHRCDRYLWLTFRWALNPNHDGRQLRLFERGQREERWVIADLRKAGFEVRDRENRKQIRVRWGHVGGSVDGLIRGLLEAPATEHVLEVKTSNAKQFAHLKQWGVRRAKHEHWVQMQVYMLGLKLDRAFYVAVCKDNDEIHAERVHFDRAVAEAAVERGQKIVNSVAPPERMYKEYPPCVLKSKDGTRWPCQFYELCHGQQLPERNCRTCCFSTPTVSEEGEPKWTCDAKGGRVVSSATQRKGCKAQKTIPPIINADWSDDYKGAMHYSFPDGTTYSEN